MTYEFIFNIASDFVKKRQANGCNITPNDTVCTIYTPNGNIYSGMSSVAMYNGFQNFIHAEVDAINNMKSRGENVIESIIVLNAVNFNPILPCNGCINYMLSLNPQNANCVILTPTQNIRLTDVGSFASGGPQNSVPLQNMQNNYQPPQGAAMNSGYIPNNMYSNGQQTSVYINNSMPIPNMQNSMQMSSMQNSMYINQPVGGQRSQPASSYVSRYNDNASEGDYLKNKVNHLLEDEPDEEEEEKKPKKKKFGLFG